MRQAVFYLVLNWPPVRPGPFDLVAERLHVDVLSYQLQVLDLVGPFNLFQHTRQFPVLASASEQLGNVEPGDKLPPNLRPLPHWLD